MPGAKEPKRRIMRAFKMNEISGVDSPAQAGALMTIMKRNDSLADKPATTAKQKLAKQAALTTSREGHSHLIRLDHGGGEFTSGETDWTDGHIHPWIRSPEGNIIIGEAHGHTHEVQQYGKNSSLPGAPAMTTETAAKSAEQTQKDLEARLAKAEAINALSASEREYFDALEGTEKDTFLGKSAESRQSDIKKFAEGNAVVYTAEDGTEYTKKDDPRLVTMAKNADASAEKMRQAEKRASDADLRKRAEDLTHIPGDVETRMEMLRAIDGISDEATRKRSVDALTAQNIALGETFKAYGHSGVSTDPEDNSDDPVAKLDTLAKSYAKEHNVSEAVAYDQVLRTPEGQALYDESAG